MDEKKQSANWKIAAGHVFKSIIVAPVIFIMVAFFPIFIINKNIGGTTVTITWWISVVMMIAIWFGVKLSAKGIAKRYVVTESDKIINISLIISIVILALDRISKFVQPEGMSGGDVIYTFTSVLMLIVFYITSKKYIQNS